MTRLLIYALRLLGLPKGNLASELVVNTPISPPPKARRAYTKTLGGRLTSMLELAAPRNDIEYDVLNVGAPGSVGATTTIETTEVLAVKTVVGGKVVVRDADSAAMTATKWNNANNQDSLAIWTDGSRLEGKWVGGAAVYQEEDEKWKGRGIHLWCNKEVYDAEQYALAEGLDVAITLKEDGTLERRGINRIALFTDTQAALDRIQTDAPGPGQYLAQRIAAREIILLAAGITTEHHWIPGHKDVTGNEVADRVAKAAARSNKPDPSDFDDVEGFTGNEVSTILLRPWADWYMLLSYLRRQTTELRWMKSIRWVKARRGNRSYRMTEKQKPDPLASAAKKTIASRFFQLKTTHAHIATHQFNIKQRANKLCWWCKAGATQTREHLFKRCPRWRTEQKTMWAALDRDASKTPISMLFAEEKCNKAILEFLATTGVGKMNEEAKIGYGAQGPIWSGDAGHEEWLRSQGEEEEGGAEVERWRREREEEAGVG